VLREEIRREHKFEDILAKSAVMQGVFRTIAKIANYKTTVLITGESGVGKELVSRALHSRSNRAGHSFVPVNCGAIPENLLESELFGHKKGAFTDAVADRNGLFSEADGGTLFLDEIGELPLGLQVKLLRVLEDGKIADWARRRTWWSTCGSSPRLTAICSRRRRRAASARTCSIALNVLPIHVPPLRERREGHPRA
jgi:two-component system response regulator AtoC